MPNKRVNPEHQQLIDILKFTPVTYTIDISGYGGETYAGTVDRKVYDYFMKNELDIDEYAGDWDNEMGVPDEFQPYSPGQQYDCDNIFHGSGASMEDCSVIRVYNENNVEIFSCTLDTDALEAAGVQYEEVDESYIEHQPKGTIAIWGGHGEKGTLFGGKIELKAPFDPKKIKINYGDYDGWTLTSSVDYDGEYIDNDDYSTSGKWSETKWIVVGGEEALGDAPQEETTVDEKPEEVPNFEGIPLTEWFTRDSNYPTRKGRYEVIVKSEQAWPFSTTTDFANWNGSVWSNKDVISWRGLTEKYKK